MDDHRFAVFAAEAAGARLLEVRGAGPKVRFRFAQVEDGIDGGRAMRRKIEQARREAGPLPVYAVAHGYGPASDFRRRLEAAWEASPAGVWLNRYGYLSDEKLKIIGEITSS